MWPKWPLVVWVCANCLRPTRSILGGCAYAHRAATQFTSRIVVTLGLGRGDGKGGKAGSHLARSTWQSRHASRSPSSAVSCPPSPLSRSHSSSPVPHPPLLNTSHSTFSTPAQSTCSAAAVKSSSRGCPGAMGVAGWGGGGFVTFFLTSAVCEQGVSLPGAPVPAPITALLL